MRFLLILAMGVPMFAQIPVAQLNNATRPASKDFQVGDRFEIVITGAAKQPVSVRTTRMGRTDVKHSEPLLTLSRSGRRMAE